MRRRSLKIQLINDLMCQAGLEPLSKEQLMALAKTPSGKRLESALLRFQAGDTESKQILSLFAISHAPSTRAKLRALGFHLEQGPLTRLFLDQGTSLITMMDKAMSDREDRKFFVAYMIGLGHTLLPAESQPGAAPYFSFKVYGRSGALTISEARTRAGEHTMQIDAALALADGPRLAFDWKHKIIVQLSPSEMLQVLGLFEKQISTLKLVGHGAGHDKFAEFAVQDNGIFVRVGQLGRSPVAVPVSPPDAVRVITLLYRQLLANDPHMDITAVRALVSNCPVPPVHKRVSQTTRVSGAAIP